MSATTIFKVCERGWIVKAMLEFIKVLPPECVPLEYLD